MLIKMKLFKFPTQQQDSESKEIPSWFATTGMVGQWID